MSKSQGFRGDERYQRQFSPRGRAKLKKGVSLCPFRMGAVRGVTGPEGKVQLRLPATERLGELVAWHPQLGVGGLRHLNNAPADDINELIESLSPDR